MFEMLLAWHFPQIDLFWLTRSQQSLGWFIEIFKELEEEQLALGIDPPLVNVHLYLTGGCTYPQSSILGR